MSKQLKNIAVPTAQSLPGFHSSNGTGVPLWGTIDLRKIGVPKGHRLCLPCRVPDFLSLICGPMPGGSHMSATQLQDWALRR
jgi:hypothetical protein